VHGIIRGLVLKNQTHIEPEGFEPF